MRLLLFSDSHHLTRNMFKVLERVGEHMDGILHMGDGLGDLKNAANGLFLLETAGNCDGFPSAPPFKTMEAAGKTIVITHGHLYGVHGENHGKLPNLARETGADICLFGHTHIPLITREDGVLIMNPGSISRPRGGFSPSYGVIEIEPDGCVVPSVVNIPPDYFRR